MGIRRKLWGLAHPTPRLMDFNWSGNPEERVSFIELENASAIYNHLGEYLMIEPNNFGLSYFRGNGVVGNGNSLLASRVDTLLRNNGLRLTNMCDLNDDALHNILAAPNNSYMERRLLEYKSSGICFPAIVISGREAVNPFYTSTIDSIVNLMEDKEGMARFPALITGFDIESWGLFNRKKGFNVVPRDDFKVMYDERLQFEKYGKRKFSLVDDMGLPILDPEGDKVWNPLWTENVFGMSYVEYHLRGEYSHFGGFPLINRWSQYNGELVVTDN